MVMVVMVVVAAAAAPTHWRAALHTNQHAFIQQSFEGAGGWVGAG